MMSPGMTGADEPPGNHGLDLRPPRMPPAELHQRGERRAERNFVIARTFDVARDREDLRAAVVRLADFEVILRADRQQERQLAANVSVLLIVVGLPYTPKLAGNGGVNARLAFSCLPAIRAARFLRPQM